jgi:2-dehydro-3-deoxyphosphogalactonate aldolase
MNAKEMLAQMPLVAILRGVRPQEILPVAEALYTAGIRAVEVPLNSPEPFQSIALLADAFEGQILSGAGTVLSVADLYQVMQAGGRIAVAPNTDRDVIRRAIEKNILPIPGFATATEAFAAYQAGARYLKLFPAATYGIEHMAALKAVLPRDAVVFAVGGVKREHMPAWWGAGARGFGVGSEVYHPGQTPEETGLRARAVVAALDALRQPAPSG